MSLVGVRGWQCGCGGFLPCRLPYCPLLHSPGPVWSPGAVMALGGRPGRRAQPVSSLWPAPADSSWARTPGPRVCSAPVQGLQHLPRASGLEAGGRGSEATLEGPRIPVVSRCPASPLGIHLYPCRLPADLRRHWQMQKQSLLLTVLPAPTIASGQSPVINPLTVSPGGPASLIKASS